MKTLIDFLKIKDFELENITDYDKKILSSMDNYLLLNDKLTENQEDLVTKILKREFNLKDIEYKKCFLYREYFYRTDYHGDYLQDSKYILSETEIEQSKIQDLHALQYNYVNYENKYKFEKIVAVPVQIKNLNEYANYFMKDFEKLIMKLPRARTSNSKYNIVKAIKTILTEEYDISKVDKVLRYKHF